MQSFPNKQQKTVTGKTSNEPYLISKYSNISLLFITNNLINISLNTQYSLKFYLKSKILVRQNVAFLYKHPHPQGSLLAGSPPQAPSMH